MYLWMLSKGYITILILACILIPILFAVNKKNKNMFDQIFKGFILFNIIAIMIFLLKKYHINYIEHLCFDYPILVYKKNIPRECFNFNPMEYQGIGWPIKLFFWLFIYWLYVFMLLSLKWFYNKFKRK